MSWGAYFGTLAIFIVQIGYRIRLATYLRHPLFGDKDAYRAEIDGILLTAIIGVIVWGITAAAPQTPFPVFLACIFLIAWNCFIIWQIHARHNKDTKDAIFNDEDTDFVCGWYLRDGKLSPLEVNQLKWKTNPYRFVRRFWPGRVIVEDKILDRRVELEILAAAGSSNPADFYSNGISIGAEFQSLAISLSRDSFDTTRIIESLRDFKANHDRNPNGINIAISDTPSETFAGATYI